LVNEGYQAFLELHSGVRPRNPQTTHNSVTLTQLAAYKDNWNILLQELN